VPRYKKLMDERDQKRAENVRQMAEKSAKLSKLPKRMAEDAERKKNEELRSKSVELPWSFQPPRAKPVPDFRRLQKQFQASLESKRKEFKSTEPQPFTFHQPKPTAELRQYLDIENQFILP